MNAAIVLAGGLGLFFVAYRWYSRALASRLFQVDDSQITPAHTHKDGVDFVPTNRHVLLGHHYTSIAGAAPIVGPAIAVYWGWLPAVLWVVLGTIFIGAVHDYSTLMVSCQQDGRSMGDIAGRVVTPRVRTLFLLTIYFLAFIVLAVFAFLIAKLFVSNPASVMPVNFEIVVALVIGWMAYRKKWDLLVPSLVALVLLYVLIYLAAGNEKLQWAIPAMAGLESIEIWIILLLVYSFIASVLPVWVLLQPRDFINSHQLFLALGLLITGIFIANPEIEAPAINPNPVGAPPLFPLLFITIACGAISGFHGLVSSGTTSKQMDKMSHGREIGYGGMLGEGLLALISTLAVSAGLKGEWLQHYAHYDTVNGLGNFVKGAATFLEALHINTALATTVVSVVVISFAATTLDTATRIQRIIVQEIGASHGIKVFQNRYVGALLAVIPAGLLALYGSPDAGRGGFVLWPLFGTTNQMVGGISLLVVFVYLARRKRPKLPILLPMVFLLVMTSAGMVVEFNNRWSHPTASIITTAGEEITGKFQFEKEGVVTITQKGVEKDIPLDDMTAYTLKRNWLVLGLMTLLMILEGWIIVESALFAVKVVRGRFQEPVT